MKVQEGRGSPCTLRNLIAMGAESELNVPEGEQQHICKMGLSPQGFRGQSRDFQDWEMCEGRQQPPALCCDRSSVEGTLCWIGVAGFVHRDWWCCSNISCACAHSVRQG